MNSSRQKDDVRKEKFGKQHPARQLADMMSRLYAYGLTTTSGGNLSIKDENGAVWITPGSIDKSCLQPEDIIRIDADGTVSGKHKPSIETKFHTNIYDVRPDVHAVIHAHSPASSAFCINRTAPDLNVLPEAALSCGKAVMSGYATPGSRELADKVSEKAEQGYNIILLDNHGTIAAGTDLLHALHRYEAVDVAANAITYASAFGEPKSMEDEDIRLLLALQNEQHAAQEPRKGQTGEQENLLFAEDREETARFSRRAYSRRLFTSSLGVLSKRVSGGSGSGDEPQFIITPADKDLGNLQADETVFMQGCTAEAGKTASLWAAFHNAIYEKHPEVQSVMMAVPASSLSFGITGVPYDARTLTEAYAIMQDVEELPFRKVLRDGSLLADALKESTPVVLIDHGGLVAAGGTVLQALDRIEVAEVSMKAALRSRQLESISAGSPVKLDDESIEAIKDFFGLK